MNINLTLIGQSFAFILFVWFCMRFVWPPIMGSLTERREKIASGLKAAQEAERQLELARKQIKKMLTSAREDARQLAEEADMRAVQIIEDAKKKAHEESERMLRLAQAEIDLNIVRAREELRDKLGVIVFSGVKKIVEKEVDQKTHQQFIKELTAKL